MSHAVRSDHVPHRVLCFILLSANCGEKPAEWYFQWKWVQQVGRASSQLRMEEINLTAIIIIIYFASLQSGHHLWGVFVLQFTCANSRYCNWTENDHVFQWPALQVTMVMVITYRIAAAAEACCSLLFYMFLSSGYIAVFIIPSTWAFYLTSVLIGIGAASEFPLA